LVLFFTSGVSPASLFPKHLFNQQSHQLLIRLLLVNFNIALCRGRSVVVVVVLRCHHHRRQSNRLAFWKDPRHNLLAQVSGTKSVVLFDPSQDTARRLYPVTSGLCTNTSQVNAAAPDLARFPLFKEAVGWHGDLAAGEMLYLPPRWWHYVASRSTSYSVSFWWGKAWDEANPPRPLGPLGVTHGKMHGATPGDAAVAAAAALGGGGGGAGAGGDGVGSGPDWPAVSTSGTSGDGDSAVAAEGAARSAAGRRRARPGLSLPPPRQTNAP